ncbi:MAG: hypothetical protein J6Q80_07160, partial [Lentisphaeria bacterium]|nr:hypothetical protein [Lentisphaeria bacterium]
TCTSTAITEATSSKALQGNILQKTFSRRGTPTFSPCHHTFKFSAADLLCLHCLSIADKAAPLGASVCSDTVALSPTTSGGSKVELFFCSISSHKKPILLTVNKTFQSTELL